jgi:hypothetical protein
VRYRVHYGYMNYTRNQSSIPGRDNRLSLVHNIETASSFLSRERNWSARKPSDHSPVTPVAEVVKNRATLSFHLRLFYTNALMLVQEPRSVVQPAVLYTVT